MGNHIASDNSILRKAIEVKEDRNFSMKGKFGRRGRPSKKEIAKAHGSQLLTDVIGMSKKEIAEIIQATGCGHPLAGMAELARDAHAAGNAELAFQIYKELAQYIAPKRKAIEISTAQSDDSPLVIIMPDTPTTPDEDDIEDGEIVA